MWEQLFTSIHTEVQKHEKFEDFHHKDPLAFLKVVTELIKTSIRGDEYKKKSEIKKLYCNMHQGLKTDISSYYEQFKNVRQLYKNAKSPDISEEEAARDFYNGINRIKFGQMIILFENGILTYEKTVDAAYQKSSRFVTSHTTISNNGKILQEMKVLDEVIFTVTKRKTRYSSNIRQLQRQKQDLQT